MKADKLEKGKEIQHDFLDPDLDPYPCYHPDFISGVHTGDVCPRCGEALRADEIVVRFDGEKGTIYELDPEGPVPFYHIKCFTERRAERDKTGSLEDYM